MRILFLILAFISPLASAGSFLPMLDNFEITSQEAVSAIKPEFVVKSIRRGSDDGNFASTSDAGIITFQLNNFPAQSQGYIFEIVEGKFEDQLFYDKPVTPSKFVDSEGSFTFIWLDGSSDEQEAFHIKVKITGISVSGAKSEPQFLEVSDPGVKKPWWKLW